MTEEISAAVHACRSEIALLSARLAELSARNTADHERALLALRIVRDNDVLARERLWTLRGSRAYEIAFEEDEPLVTIIIPTFSNWRLLRERALPSVLGQTYARYECIVVGDDAPPEAAAAVGSFGDQRLRFVNLPYRGPYPSDPHDMHMVVGSTPFNTALALAAGRWIGSVGDDDALTPTYIETLLALARAERAEVAYGQIHHHIPDTSGEVLGAFPPQWGKWGIQCSLLHAGLRYLPLQPTDWVFVIPNDMSLLQRMLRIGVRFAMRHEVVVDYYPSLLWKDRR
ncbi:MAG: glycosyltransferase family 2 protein [Solirubrobacteraceae bacterium]